MFQKFRRDALPKSFLVFFLLTASLGSLLAQTTVKNLALEQGAEDTPAAASLALRERKYDQVVSITNNIAKKNPLSSSNWYLMAIASNRLGDFEMASKALEKAKSIDPKMGFASTPERVKNLEKSIADGLLTKKAIDQAVIPVVQPASIQDPKSSAELKPLGEKIEASIQAFELAESKAEEIEAKINVIENKILEIEEERKLKTKELSYDLIKSDQQKTISILILSILSFVFFTSLLLAVYIKKYHLKIKQSKLISVSTMPLDKLINHNRDNAEILLERLDMHGHKETALYQSTLKSLVSLQIESGKSRIEVKKILRGVAVSDTEKDLDGKPMIIGKDEPKNIHNTALKMAMKNKISI